MKKILPFLVVGILVLSGLGAVGLADNAKENNIQIIGDGGDASFIYEDELDQEQPDQTEGYGIPVGAIHIPEPPISDINLYIQVAQSFIPTKEILTRVELLVGRNSTASYPYVLAIREELTEENIVETSLNPEEFVIENYSWLEFDFEDIWVTVGQTYYIVCYTENVTDNWYAWAANNDSESYPYGCAWVSLDDGDTWTNDSVSASNEEAWTPDNGVAPLNNDDNESDMCFKTYGLEATELGIELTSTGFGISFIITNIGDAIAWEVEWTITAQGGILGLINLNVTDQWPELGVNESITVSAGPLFGLGPIKITVSAKALNAPEVSDSIDGFIIFIFIIIL
jgi:hypothetical protein